MSELQVTFIKHENLDLVIRTEQNRTYVLFICNKSVQVQEMPLREHEEGR